MKKFRVAEALSHAKQNGRQVSKQGLAALLWPDSSKATRARNMTLLVQGETKRLSPEAMQTICCYTGVDANYLLDDGKASE